MYFNSAAMASTPELGVIDRGLAGENGELAARAVLMRGLDARLVMIDAANDVDKFHVLQGLEDPELPDGPERYYCFQRWGDTGGRGQARLEGPMLAPKVEATIRRTFEEKTGHAWRSVEPGHAAKDGMYWLQAAAKPNAAARWEYYVDDGVDGKRPGWYSYEGEALEEMEELYAQHVANECAERTATRTIKSGYFSYSVDVSAMSQTNTKTRTQRVIRRVFGRAEEEDENKKSERPASKLLAMKAMKVAPPKRPPAPKTKGAPKRASKVEKRPSSSSVVPVSRRLKTAGRSAAGASKAMKVMKSKTPMKKPKASVMKKVKAKSMKAMKTMTSMKVPKAMKAKKKRGPKSTTAKKGKMMLYEVVSGRKAKTAGGLQKEDIEKNRWGKLVPKRKAVSQKKNTWMVATSEARKALGITGFCPCGGSTKQGKELYKMAKKLHQASK